MSSWSLFLVVRTPVLLAAFVRRADRRGTSERTSGGKAVTGARGSIVHGRFSVKSIFRIFLGAHPCFTRFTPEFRLFSRTGRNKRKSALLRRNTLHLRRVGLAPPGVIPSALCNPTATPFLRYTTHSFFEENLCRPAKMP